MSVVIYYHPECELHEMGPGHPESPQRLKAIKRALDSSAFSEDIIWREPEHAQREDLLRAHDNGYVDSIMHASPHSGYLPLDPDTVMNPHTLSAALYAAGSLIGAVNRVIDTPEKKVFCLIRPPGHHAERSQAMGFCFFNNVAIGALYALEVKGLKRVAIIDVDVHHGNGTQDIVEHDERILFCSAFEHPFYPGTHMETNAHVIHAPIEAGTTGDRWRQHVASWFDAIRAFKPECLFVSAGFDAHEHDLLADLKLQDEDYAWVSQQLCLIADEVCEGRMIATLEGGYDLQALARSASGFIQQMNETR